MPLETGGDEPDELDEPDEPDEPEEPVEPEELDEPDEPAEADAPASELLPPEDDPSPPQAVTVAQRVANSSSLAGLTPLEQRMPDVVWLDVEYVMCFGTWPSGARQYHCHRCQTNCRLSRTVASELQRE